MLGHSGELVQLAFGNILERLGAVAVRCPVAKLVVAGLHVVVAAVASTKPSEPRRLSAAIARPSSLPRTRSCNVFFEQLGTIYGNTYPPRLNKPSVLRGLVGRREKIY